MTAKEIYTLLILVMLVLGLIELIVACIFMIKGNMTAALLTDLIAMGFFIILCWRF